MTLKSAILAHLRKHGPTADADLAHKLKVPQTSLRRARNELVKKGEVHSVGVTSPLLWAVGKPGVMKLKPTVKGRADLDERWRLTDFCF